MPTEQNGTISTQDVSDLAALVRTLAYHLKRAKPESTLPARATDFLKRKGLERGPLRAE